MIFVGPTVKKHLSSDYAGLVESDERWKTVNSVWLYQVRFSGYPNFWFLAYFQILKKYATLKIVYFRELSKTRLDRIKKIDAHKNGTITTGKYIKLQEFRCISWLPENSGSREILISSSSHFGSKFRESFEKVPCTLELNPKEQIFTLTFEIWLVFVGKISRFLMNQE